MWLVALISRAALGQEMEIEVLMELRLLAEVHEVD